jgi:hypothetical protein
MRAGISCLFLPATACMGYTSFTPYETLGLGCLATGALGASASMWFFSNRYIGELSVLPARAQLTISTFDFWGNRQVSVSPAVAADVQLRTGGAGRWVGGGGVD